MTLLISTVLTIQISREHCADESTSSGLSLNCNEMVGGVEHSMNQLTEAEQ